MADPRTRGLVITTLGVLILTPDGLLVRLAAMDPLSLTVLRGLFQTVGGVLLVLAMRGGATAETFRALGRSGVWMSLLFGLGNLFFVLALSRTSVANVLVLMATIPLFAAALGWLWLGEVLPRRTWIAIAAALAGVVVVAAESGGRPTLLGDLSAMSAALCNAAFFVLVRKRPEVDRVPTVALAGLISAALAVPAAFLLGQQIELAGVEMRQVLWIMLMGPGGPAALLRLHRQRPALHLGSGGGPADAAGGGAGPALGLAGAGRATAERDPARRRHDPRDPGLAQPRRPSTLSGH